MGNIPRRLCRLLVVSVVGAAPAWTLAGASVSLSDYQEMRAEQALSLDEALTTAFDNNPALALQKSRVAGQRGQVVHSGRLTPSNPVIEVQGEKYPSRIPDNVNYQIRLSQEIWMGNRRDLGRDRATNELTATEQDLEFLRIATAARVRSAFFNLVLAREELATAKRAVDLMEQTSEVIETSYRQGKMTKMDVNTAVIGLARAKSQKAAAGRRLEDRRLELAEVLGVDPRLPLDVRGDFSPTLTDLPEEDRLLEVALQQRADLQAAAKRIAANESALDIAESLSTPNLKVFGFYGRDLGDNVMGGGVSIPLAITHRYRGERMDAAAGLQTAEIEAESLKLSIKRSVLSAIAQYKAARTQLEQMSESILRRSEETLQLMQQALAAGKVGAASLLSAQDNLLAVRNEYIQVQKDYIRATQALEIGTGGAVSMGVSP